MRSVMKNLKGLEPKHHTLIQAAAIALLLLFIGVVHDNAKEEPGKVQGVAAMR
jgi:hypothetical protein